MCLGHLNYTQDFMCVSTRNKKACFTCLQIKSLAYFIPWSAIFTFTSKSTYPIQIRKKTCLLLIVYPHFQIDEDFIHSSSNNSLQCVITFDLFSHYWHLKYKLLTLKRASALQSQQKTKSWLFICNQFYSQKEILRMPDFRFLWHLLNQMSNTKVLFVFFLFS